MTTQLYNLDFYQWTQRQVDLLRNEEYENLDLENLIEEIAAMAKRDRRELESRLKIILLHLLKWKYQPMCQSNRWADSLDEQRDEIAVLLRDSPSLRRELADLIVDAYARALRKAAKETKLATSVFPASCEWTMDQMLDQDFLP